MSFSNFICQNLEITLSIGKIPLRRVKNCEVRNVLYRKNTMCCPEYRIIKLTFFKILLEEYSFRFYLSKFLKNFQGIMENPRFCAV